METENRKTAAPALPLAAITALRAGNKIEAIKVVRIERNTGLKEAKDIVEDYLQSQPELKSAFANAQSEDSRSGLLGIAMLVIIGLLVWYFLRRT